MINFKQKELSMRLFEKLKARFPEIELVRITESAEDPNDIWVNITYPEDEDRQIELYEAAGEISTDILLDYGYHISIISADKSDKNAA